jgi:hypothetical protein
VKLKCVGGPSDGKVMEMPAHYMNMRVLDPCEPCPQPLNRPSCRAVGVTVRFTIYTRRICRSYENDPPVMKEIVYLAPAGVTDYETMRALLEP